MIREAKGVAVHDLSFWADTLPLLEGLPRVISDYRFECGEPVRLRLTADTGRELHDKTLERFADLTRQGSDLGRPSGTAVDRLAWNLTTAMRGRTTIGTPETNVPVPGCGIVLGGSCDLVWLPFLVELKLTAKEPNVRDVRQVLVYCGLLELSGIGTATKGIVANPRLGLLVEFDIAELLLMTGGLRIDEFASMLGSFLVSAGLSG
jgi:hypothetical protein